MGPFVGVKLAAIVGLSCAPLGALVGTKFFRRTAIGKAPEMTASVIKKQARAKRFCRDSRKKFLKQGHFAVVGTPDAKRGSYVPMEDVSP